MVEDVEGNIYLAGRIEINANNYDAFFMKTDNAGNLLWQRTFDLSTNDECWKIGISNNGDVIISGFFLYDLFLLKADTDGNIIFSKSYSGRQSILSDMLIDPENNIVLVGLMYDSNNQQQSFLSKLNNDGTLIYTALYDAPGNESFLSVTESGQYYYVAALSRAATNNGVIVKINALDGNINWANQYDINGRIDLINKVHATNNGILINGGTRDVNPPARFNQLNGLMNEDGIINSLQTYTNVITQFSSDIVGSGNGYIQTQSINNGEQFITMLLMDVNKNILGGKKYEVQQSLPIPLVRNSSNSILLTHIQKLSANGIHLIRTSENGMTPGCPEYNATEQSNPVSISSAPFSYQFSNVDLEENNIQLQTRLDGLSIRIYCGSQCKQLTINGPTTLCLSDSTISFSANKDAQCTEQVQWSFDSSMARTISSTGNEISLQFITQGTFRLTGTIGKGCAAISVNYEVRINRPLPPVYLGPDTLLCDTNQYRIAVPGYESYQWSNGSTDSVRIITRTGNYILQVKDGCGNQSMDTISIVIPSKELIAPKLPADTSICTGDTIQVYAGNGYTTYLWNDGSDNRYILVDAPGKYWVEVTNAEGCTASDSITITQAECAQFVVFPNAFSPNNDGRNDRFKPAVNVPLNFYQLVIFNRWGQKLYESRKVDEGWDGQPVIAKDKTSTFVYFCRYQVAGQPMRIIKGTLTLIR